ncbi:unnamed protein product, partial [Choristocarpus tenellus]
GFVKASYFGECMASLPFWQHLGTMRSCLLVDCRTPSQWKPEQFPPTNEELWGPSRTGHRTLANHPRTGVASARKELEKILGEGKILRESALTFERLDRFAESNNEATETGRARSDFPGTPSSLPKHSSVQHPRGMMDVDNRPSRGGRYPHFFYGLRPEFRHLFVMLHVRNRALFQGIQPAVGQGNKIEKGIGEIREEIAKGTSDTLHPDDACAKDDRGTEDSKVDEVVPLSPEGSCASVAASHLAPSDAVGEGGVAEVVRRAGETFNASLPNFLTGVAKDPETKALEMHVSLLQQLSEAATRLGRARRLTAMGKAARRTARRHRAAICIQRCFRGRLGRLYAEAWCWVSAVAATKIAASARSRAVRLAYIPWRDQCRTAAGKIQALFRGHVARQFYCWVHVNYASARDIQRIVRGFLGRRDARQRRQRGVSVWRGAWVELGVPALLNIQRAVRGFLARRRCIRLRAGAVWRQVVVPSAGVLQRVYRGRLGRKVRDRKILEIACITCIQRHIRGYIRRKWWAKMVQWLLEEAMSTRLQKVSRGYIDRQLIWFWREKKRFLTVVEPAVVLLQSQWRGYTKRRDLAR